MYHRYNGDSHNSAREYDQPSRPLVKPAKIRVVRVDPRIGGVCPPNNAVAHQSNQQHGKTALNHVVSHFQQNSSGPEL